MSRSLFNSSLLSLTSSSLFASLIASLVNSIIKFIINLSTFASFENSLDTKIISIDYIFNEIFVIIIKVKKEDKNKEIKEEREKKINKKKDKKAKKKYREIVDKKKKI